MDQLPPVHTLFKLYEEAKLQDIRFGQWFYNTYDKSGVPNELLFYEIRKDVAYMMIARKYYGL